MPIAQQPCFNYFNRKAKHMIYLYHVLHCDSF